MRRARQEGTLPRTLQHLRPPPPPELPDGLTSMTCDAPWSRLRFQWRPLAGFSDHLRLCLSWFLSSVTCGSFLHLNIRHWSVLNTAHTCCLLWGGVSIQGAQFYRNFHFYVNKLNSTSSCVVLRGFKLCSTPSSHIASVLPFTLWFAVLWSALQGAVRCVCVCVHVHVHGGSVGRSVGRTSAATWPLLCLLG